MWFIWNHSTDKIYVGSASIPFWNSFEVIFHNPLEVLSNSLITFQCVRVLKEVSFQPFKNSLRFSGHIQKVEILWTLMNSFWFQSDLEYQIIHRDSSRDIWDLWQILWNFQNESNPIWFFNPRNSCRSVSWDILKTVKRCLESPSILGDSLWFQFSLRFLTVFSFPFNLL